MRLNEKTYVDQAEHVIKELVEFYEFAARNGKSGRNVQERGGHAVSTRGNGSQKSGQAGGPQGGRGGNGLEKDDKLVTTSKLRNLLSMVMDIYNQTLLEKDDILSPQLRNRIEYLRIRAVYESGRDKGVKRFIQKAEILDCLKEIGDSKSNYLLFTHYMEALVAFRKYYAKDE